MDSSYQINLFPYVKKLRMPQNVQVFLFRKVTMSTTEDKIVDFDPALVGELIPDGDIIRVVFPSQPIYTANESTKQLSCRCELRIENASVVGQTTALPWRVDELEVEYEEGSRSFFLPVNFAKQGYIKLSFKVDGRKTVEITGSKIDLIVNNENEKGHGVRD